MYRSNGYVVQLHPPPYSRPRPGPPLVSAVFASVFTRAAARAPRDPVTAPRVAVGSNGPGFHALIESVATSTWSLVGAAIGTGFGAVAGVGLVEVNLPEPVICHDHATTNAEWITVRNLG